MGTKFKEADKQAVRALHVQLKADFPKAFGATDSNPFYRPVALKIGVHKDIMAAYPALPTPILRQFIKWYVYTPEYLQLIAPEAKRFDLAGLEVGEVTKDEIAHAQMLIAQFALRKGKKVEPAEVAKTSPTGLVESVRQG
jgi:sRNA-binding protein